MRFSIHADFPDDARARLRTALKLMGAGNIHIREAAPEAAAKPIKPDNTPTSAEAIACAELFGRKPEQEWSDTEIRLFKAARQKKLITTDSMKLMVPYYKAERKKGTDPHTGGHHRRTLEVFLRNVSGENDRAVAYSQRAKPGPRSGEWTPHVLPAPRVAQEEAEPTPEMIEQARRRLIG